MMNTKRHGALYRCDMRPVFKSQVTNNKWCRMRKSVRTDEEGRLFFEHTNELENDTIYFAFTYPYSYSDLQAELIRLDSHINNFEAPGSIFYKRELLTRSIDQRRVDLLTITSVDGASSNPEDQLENLFPDYDSTVLHTQNIRPPCFPEKEVIIVSARVHPGEVPAQHTMKGIIDLLMDPHDPRSKALRNRYVFKIVPMLNPDGMN
jgi:hypothetical protein